MADEVAMNITVIGNGNDIRSTDIYIAGNKTNGEVYAAGHWKNDVWVGLNVTDPTKDSFITSFAVSGSNVYAVGRYGDYISG